MESFLGLNDDLLPPGGLGLPAGQHALDPWFQGLRVEIEERQAPQLVGDARHPVTGQHPAQVEVHGQRLGWCLQPGHCITEFQPGGLAGLTLQQGHPVPVPGCLPEQAGVCIQHTGRRIVLEQEFLDR